MLIRMTRQRVIQDAGQERPLVIGGEYDLSDVIASAFIATGAAERVRAIEMAAVAVAPENKAAKNRRR